MRVISRIALAVLVLLVVPAIYADHLTPECQLSLATANTPASSFALSPHGVFRSGSLAYVLRGQTLTTYNITDLGDLSIAREDFVGAMGARETTGGIAFSNGFLYVSSDIGLEIFDLRNVRAGAGGVAPALVSRTRNAHYRRLTIQGNILAGVYPASDMPCVPDGTEGCSNSIDLYNIATPAAPQLLSSISSIGEFIGWDDIAFAGTNLLWATGPGGTFAFNISNPFIPTNIGSTIVGGTFLATNGTNLLAIGQPSVIGLFLISRPTTFATLGQIAAWTVPTIQTDRANPLMFHPQAWIDDVNGRVITMVDEQDPLRLTAARTLAFDLFDYTIPLYEGSFPRPYESITYTNPDEVKHNPVAIGPFVYVIGEMSGMQSWGSCGQVTGRVEIESTHVFNCGGAELHGWVTGTQKVNSVEVFLDGTSLGLATMPSTRDDISSRSPVFNWRIPVNLDNTSKGEHLIRVIGTDALGNRRQFASQRLFFNGPGANCTSRKRAASK
jgi:hypothetical protein